MLKSIMINARGFFRSDFFKTIRFQPRIFFFVFLISNTLISYFPFSLQVKIWIGLWGILIPFLLGLAVLKKWSPPKSSNLFFKEKMSSPPFWLWLLFGALLLVTRFYRLTSLPFWPHPDDGIFGFLGLGEMRHWRWDLLWGQIRFEPFIVWTLGLYFKLVPPSLLSLRLYPALLSLATAWGAYATARILMPKWTSFFFAWFVAFSFWEMTMARFCFIGDWVPLFEFAGLGLLGLLWKASHPRAQWGWLAALSFFAGLGFYLWSGWPAIWMGLAFLLVWRFGRAPFPGPLFPPLFLLSSFLLGLPLFMARLSVPGGMAHIGGAFSFLPFHSFCLYVAGIFWNIYPGFPYQFNWGGFLNPLLDSLVFLGFLILARVSSKYFLGLFIVCLGLTLLPAFMTKDLEMYRVMAALPLLMLPAVAGFWGLVARPWNLKSIGWAGALLLGLFLLDAYDYVDRHCDIHRTPIELQGQSVPDFQAYQWLERKSETIGPMYVFSDMIAVSDNWTLNIACYPFDAILNPKFSKSRPEWIALLAKIDFAPYLLDRFPGIEYEILSPEKPNHLPNGLFLIPVSRLEDKTLGQWLQAQRFCADLDMDLNNKASEDTWKPFIDRLMGQKTVFSSDPFLWTLFWERIAIFEVMDQNFSGGRQAYHRAITQGVPVAHLYHDESLCDRYLGKTTQAQLEMLESERRGTVFGQDFISKYGMKSPNSASNPKQPGI